MSSLWRVIILSFLLHSDLFRLRSIRNPTLRWRWMENYLEHVPDDEQRKRKIVKWTEESPKKDLREYKRQQKHFIWSVMRQTNNCEAAQLSEMKGFYNLDLNIYRYAAENTFPWEKFNHIKWPSVDWWNCSQLGHGNRHDKVFNQNASLTLRPVTYNTFGDW